MSGGPEAAQFLQLHVSFSTIFSCSMTIWPSRSGSSSSWITATWTWATWPRRPGCTRLRFPAIERTPTCERTPKAKPSACPSLTTVPGDPLDKSIVIRPLERNRYSNRPNR
uniref:(northern house mosquito) hypothetical protein n=1 Tax=Culex pipiens TaxID=7175 RepID=A0A8D8G9J9_CULPI